QANRRAKPLGRRGAAALRIDHDQARKAGRLVDLLGHGDAFLDVLETRLAGVLGDDGTRERIPVAELLPRLHLRAVLDGDGRAVWHLVALALAAAVVDDHDLAVARDRDLLAARVEHPA